MNLYTRKFKRRILFRFFTLFLISSFFFTGILNPYSSYAQSVSGLPSPGSYVSLSSGFQPTIIRGITLDPQNPFQYEFLIDQGEGSLNEEALKKEAERLIKYFLASLTIPEEDLWVNLSPYEHDQMISKSLGQTILGKDLLSQDYLLKQITASLLYPETNTGNDFWKKVYGEAQKTYGTTNIPINTFNKVWVIPQKAVIYEEGNTAIITNSRLKVMLEEDYLAMKKGLESHKENSGLDSQEADDINSLSSKIVREIIIPLLEKEVNEGKNFATLRQVFNSLILATWFKRNLKESLLGRIYMDQKKTKGVDLDDRTINEKIYQQYLKAFQKGVFDLIKEDFDGTTQERIVRRYFSGGFELMLNPRQLVVIRRPGELKPEDLQQVSMVADLSRKGKLSRVRSLLKNIPSLTQNVQEILERVDRDQLESLSIRGAVDLDDTVLKGFVKIDSRMAGRFSFKGVADQLEEVPAVSYTPDGRISLENVKILVNEKGRLQIRQYHPSQMVGEDLAELGLAVYKIEDWEMNWIQEDVLASIEEGLSQDLEERTSMFPTFLSSATGQEVGRYIGVDFSGSHLRIYDVEIKEGKPVILDSEEITWDKPQKKGTLEQIFDTVAKQVKKLMEKANLDLQGQHSLGFTFAFALLQQGLTDAILKVAGKEWEIEAYENQNIGQVFQDALIKNGLPSVKVEAILNDTAATQLLVPQATMAMIMGTGFNISFYDPYLAQIINVEAGGLDIGHDIKNHFDKELLDIILPKDPYHFEKMITSKPLGELTRLIIKELYQRGKIFKGKDLSVLENEEAIPVVMMSKIEEKAQDKKEIIKILENTFQIQGLTETDADLFLKVVRLISDRAARLAASTIAGVIRYVDPELKQLKTQGHKISVDGNMFWKYNGMKSRIEGALGEIFGEAAKKIQFIEIKGASGLGSAMAAAIVKQKKEAALITDSVKKATQLVAFQKLVKDEFRKKMRDIYGVKDRKAAETLVGEFAQLAFDGKDNRMGWGIDYLEWLLNNPEAIESVLKDAEEIKRNFKYVIFSGMGGSGLSIETVKTTLGEPEGLKIYSLRTTDPKVINNILDEISELEGGSPKRALEKTLVVAISKSGTTQETISHKVYFEELFTQIDMPKEEIKNHLWLMTDPGSKMERETEEKGYPLRYIQLNGETDIGGRFTSPTTNIFLLPMALAAPQRITDILKKAKAMNDMDNIEEDTFLALGAYLYEMAKNQKKDKVTLIIPEELRALSIWLEQLFEESLGKDGKGVTIFYGENLSPNVLKAKDENDRVFIRINLAGRKTNEEFVSYLTENDYPVFDISVNDIDSLGGLMLGFQRTVATIGYLWGINFVNQPGVEGYKDQTRQVLKTLKPGEKVQPPQEWKFSEFRGLKIFYSPLLETGFISEEELQKEVEVLKTNMGNAAGVYAAILNLLRKKGKGFEAMELASYGRMSLGFREILEGARYDIFTKGLKMPSKLAEGPDKNHSFQQNIAQGKDMFFSTYFLPDKTVQPLIKTYEENPLRAQTIGTIKSLVEVKRKAVLMTLQETIEDSQTVVNDFFEEVRRYLGLSPEEVEKTRPQLTTEERERDQAMLTSYEYSVGRYTFKLEFDPQAQIRRGESKVLETFDTQGTLMADEIQYAQFDFREGVTTRSVYRDGQLRRIHRFPENKIPEARDIYGWAETAFHKKTQTIPQDQAMLTQSQKPKKVGGIDFNPSFLDLEVNREQEGIILPHSVQEFPPLNTEGFYPVIINIVPATLEHLPILLNMLKQDKSFELSFH